MDWSPSPITIRSTARWSCFDACPTPATSSSAKRCRAGCPDGDIEVHLGVYGMTEALHRDVQPLRRNVFDVIALSAARPTCSSR